MILSEQSPRRQRLPLSLAVKPLAFPDHRLPGGQSPLHQILALCPAEERDIAVLNLLFELPDRLRLAIEHPDVRKPGKVDAPAHSDPLLRHRLRLNKTEILPQTAPHRLTEWNLMMIDVIRDKNKLHVTSDCISRRVRAGVPPTPS